MTIKQHRVSGFNPRFVVWWLNGIRAPTTVEFPTRRDATRTRRDLYSLRKAMHVEDHYAASLVDKGEIIRRPVDPLHTEVDDPHTLTIRPVNFDVNVVLDAAGIKAPDLDEDITRAPKDAATPAPPPPPLDYANLMEDLTEEPKLITDEPEPTDKP